MKKNASRLRLKKFVFIYYDQVLNNLYRQTAIGLWYEPVEIILPLPPARAISFPLVRTTTHGQSFFPDIALHISNYYINTTYKLAMQHIINLNVFDSRNEGKYN